MERPPAVTPNPSGTMASGVPKSGSVFGNVPATQNGQPHLPAMRHQLPQMPQRSQHHMAVSKASRKEMPSSVKNLSNIIPKDEVIKSEPDDQPSDTQSMFPPVNIPSEPVKVQHPLPTPPASETASDNTSPKPSQVSPNSSTSNKSSVSPTTPIKLRIRRSICDGKQAELTSTVTSGEPDATVESAGDTESSSVLDATSNDSVVPPGQGRAKTKGELKKQLLEKKEKKSGHASSGESSNASGFKYL